MNAFDLVSIIICTRGRPDALRQTLTSLSGVEMPATLAAELLVVENGAKQEAEALTANFHHPRIAARYWFEPKAGKSRALNRALAESSGQILLFSDDDVRFPSDWVSRMAEPILAGRADAVAGGVALAPHLLRPWMIRIHRAWLASTADYLTADDPSEMCGANMAVSRRALAVVGGYDVELGPGLINGGFEETLLSWQLKQAGFRILGAPGARVEHHPDPRRLYYENWLRVAKLQGCSRAYVMHHWLHQEMRCPRLKQSYFQAKLVLRRLVSKRRKSDEEGIAPWELSYVMDIARCAQYARERRRPRNYPLRGLHKFGSDRRPLVS